MNIGINSSDYLKSQTGASARGEEVSGNVRGTFGRGEFDASTLKSGQTISGEITSLDGNNVTLRLGNGQEISARLSGNAGLSVGQLLSFEINSKTNQNTIELRPLFANLATNNTVSTALKAAGLALSFENISMTNAMMEEGMSIDRNSLSSMAKLVAAFPSSDPASIVRMDKLGLQINELNVTQYENYSNFKHQIINEVVNLESDFSNAVIDSLKGHDVSGSSLASELLSVIDDSLLPEDTVHLPDEMYAALKETVNSENADGMYSPKNPAAVLVQEQAAGADIAEATAQNANAGTETGGVTSSLIKLAPEFLELTNALSTKMPEEISAKSFLNTVKDAVAVLNGNVADLGLSGDRIAKALSALADKSEFKSLLSDFLESNLTLTPSKIGKEGEIEKFYERMDKITHKLINLANGTEGALKSVAENAGKISDNVNFMNHLNEFINYVQLPLKMAEENAHGELYVYSNKKNLADKEGNLTALLHLDMEHLGPMDVYVSMQNFEKVNTHFYMQSEELLDFIADNIHILDERLTAKGYSMSSAVSMKDANTDTPITQEFLKDSPDEKSRLVTAMGFDVRA